MYILPPIDAVAYSWYIEKPNRINRWNNNENSLGMQLIGVVLLLAAFYIK